MRCGLPFASNRSEDSVEPLCGSCHAESPAFDGARSYGLYRGALRAAILELKFRRRERLGRRLGARLASVWFSAKELSEAPKPIIVPVPLYRVRERERGFNQAALVVEGLVKELRDGHGSHQAAVIDTKCLYRAKPTVPQTGLSLAQRRENVRGVFAVACPERVHGQTMVIVDDVMTTGATVSACARALKRAGAESVWVLTLARATPLFPDTMAGDVASTVDGHVIER